jgi:preprotein translocase subunit SecF
MNIVGKRYWFFALSALVILPGLGALVAWGLPLAIDFTGGSLLELRFEGEVPSADAIGEVYARLSLGEPIVQSLGSDGLVVRSATIGDEGRGGLVSELGERFGPRMEVLRFDTVGPTVGAEVAQRAAGAVGLATAGILAYITYAFRGVTHAYRYGTAAVLAMLHDVAVVVGVAALLGHFAGWQVDSLFLTALLTVIGFSVHDTIVVFDRIRENRAIHRRLDYESLVNHSIVQTLDRSINTQLTVLFTLLALLLFGGATTQHFVAILLIGVFSGTYSSIFNAAPILVVWENREWTRWFRSRA